MNIHITNNCVVRSGHYNIFTMHEYEHDDVIHMYLLKTRG